MADIEINTLITIIGVIGTWLGVYLAYKAMSKKTDESLEKVYNLLNTGEISFNKKENTQIGKNKNVQ